MTNNNHCNYSNRLNILGKIVIVLSCLCIFAVFYQEIYLFIAVAGVILGTILCSFGKLLEYRTWDKSDFYCLVVII